MTRITEHWGEKFPFMGHTGNPAHCLIKRNGNVVICTEADDNPGESITNASEIIATRYCLLHNIPFEKLIFVEHYQHDDPDVPMRPWQAQDPMNRPTFDFVTFDIYNGCLTRPKWKPTNKLRAMSIFHKGAE